MSYINVIYKFQSGYEAPWIKLVDEYQIFLHVLGLQGDPHNGTWTRVKDMFPSNDAS